MATEKRPIDAYAFYKKFANDTPTITVGEQRYVATWRISDLIADAPTVDAVEVVYCDECKSHGSCIPEETFRWMRIEKPYCCVGKRKTNTNFDAKMDGDGNEK